MGIRTASYTTTKEQNHINHMGIRTPCYSTMKGQIVLVKWVSEHHAILQWKNKIMYALSCNCSDTHVINMILFFCCSIAWCSDTHVTNMILFFYCSIAWCSDTHVTNMIWKNKIMYALSCNFSQVIPMFLQFYRYSLSVTTKPSYTTTKE
jgi:hypothetical protein